MTRQEKAALQLRFTLHCAEVEQILCHTTHSQLKLLICTTLTPLAVNITALRQALFLLSDIDPDITFSKMYAPPMVMVAKSHWQYE